MSYFSLQNSCGFDVQILSCRNLSCKSKKMTENPWQVESIQAFSIFQCPECLFETEEEIQFENHATENHSLSFVLFGKKSKSNSTQVFEKNEFEHDDSSDITIKEELKIDTNDALTNEISSNNYPIVLGINSKIKTERIETNLGSEDYHSEQNSKTIDLKTIHSDVIVPKIKEELNENSGNDKNNPLGECQNHLRVIGQNLVVVNPGLKETNNPLKTENKENKAHQCHICNRIFPDQCLTQNHMQSVHERVKLFECDICFVNLCSKHILTIVHERKKKKLSKSKRSKQPFSKRIDEFAMNQTVARIFQTNPSLLFAIPNGNKSKPVAPTSVPSEYLFTRVLTREYLFFDTF